MQKGKWTKSDFIDAIYNETGLTRTEVKLVLDLFCKNLKESLIKGNTIELRGLGTFEVKIRNARKKARNPRTGEEVPVHKHRVVSFHPGKELKLSVWKIPGQTPGQQNDTGLSD